MPNLDYSTSTLADVDEIVRVILALRKLARDSHLKTVNTQSHILRTIPPVVLAEVALRLQEAEATRG